MVKVRAPEACTLAAKPITSVSKSGTDAGPDSASRRISQFSFSRLTMDCTPSVDDTGVEPRCYSRSTGPGPEYRRKVELEC